MATPHDLKELRVDLDCYPCFLRQTVIALRLASYTGVDGATAASVIDAALEEVRNSHGSESPAHATTFMHRRIRETLGRDPYSSVKSEYNRKALAIYPSLRETILSSPDPLLTASKLAVAGNVIDFGIFSAVDMEGAVRRALGEPLGVDNFAAFSEAVRKHRQVLYLLDNAGEAVFDRLLIETLCDMGKRVTAVSKGSPVINDCTVADAREAGIGEVCELTDNGSDAVGTILEMCSRGFRDAFEDPNALVISKGQGNFETLLKQQREIFFLFQSKCGVVSRAMGIDEGAMLLLRRKGKRP